MGGAFGHAQAALRAGVGCQGIEFPAGTFAAIGDLALDFQRCRFGKIIVARGAKFFHKAAVFGGVLVVGAADLNLAVSVSSYQSGSGLHKKALFRCKVMQFEERVVIIAVAVGNGDNAGGLIAPDACHALRGDDRHAPFVAGDAEDDKVVGTEAARHGGFGGRRKINFRMTAVRQGCGQTLGRFFAASGGEK